MARKNSVVSVDVSDNNQQISFSVEGQKPFIIDLGGLSDDVRGKALAHGIVQKISDAAALGKDATPSDKYHAMKAVADRLNEGEWNKSRGDGSATPSGIIFRALFEYATQQAKATKAPAPDRDALLAKFKSMSRKDQLELRKIPEIATIMDKLRAESGPSVNVDALLGELGL